MRPFHSAPQTEKDRALQAASEARRQQKWAEQMLEDMRSVVPPEAWDLMESRLERAAEARRERMGTAPRGASAPASQ